jgi:hypothetical protein
MAAWVGDSHSSYVSWAQRIQSRNAPPLPNGAITPSTSMNQIEASSPCSIASERAASGRLLGVARSSGGRLLLVLVNEEGHVDPPADEERELERPVQQAQQVQDRPPVSGLEATEDVPCTTPL